MKQVSLFILLAISSFALSAKVALIFGVTGQDGYYLSKLLLEKGYTVHGVKRRASSFNTTRIDPLLHAFKDEFILHYGDLTDSLSTVQLITSIQPDEIYNLAAQSHVWVSFKTPEYTAQADAIGSLRILEAIRIGNLQNKTRYYQASTSELFGLVQEVPQKETTPFYPRSPYAAAKLYAYWITVNYREAYNIFCCNGILFNHESPYRGETFVTRKITRAVARIKYRLQECIELGNLDSKRDWGHAEEYVEAMWRILQHDKACDFVISTGKTYTVRYFVEEAFKAAGIEVEWQGSGIKEKGINKANGNVIVCINPSYFRPTEVELLIGDSSKVKQELGWEHTIELSDLIQEMVEHDLTVVQNGLHSLAR